MLLSGIVFYPFPLSRYDTQSPRIKQQICFPAHSTSHHPTMETDNSTNSATHPGQILREKFMNPLKITAYRLSKELGVTPITISHVLRGKRSISTSMAARLGVFFDVPGEFWLNLQARYDLSQKETLLEGCPVSRCEALDGRAFHIQESSNGDPNGCIVEITSSPNGQTPAKKIKRNGLTSSTSR